MSFLPLLELTIPLLFLLLLLTRKRGESLFSGATSYDPLTTQPHVKRSPKLYLLLESVRGREFATPHLAHERFARLKSSRLKSSRLKSDFVLDAPPFADFFFSIPLRHFSHFRFFPHFESLQKNANHHRCYLKRARSSSTFLKQAHVHLEPHRAVTMTSCWNDSNCLSHPPTILRIDVERLGRVRVSVPKEHRVVGRIGIGVLVAHELPFRGARLILGVCRGAQISRHQLQERHPLFETSVTIRATPALDCNLHNGHRKRKCHLGPLSLHDTSTGARTPRPRERTLLRYSLQFGIAVIKSPNRRKRRMTDAVLQSRNECHHTFILSNRLMS